MSKYNLTLLTDFYQLTMMQGYYASNIKNQTVVFDMFYRKNPSGNGYSIAAGLEQVIEYIKELHFSEDDIHYLRTKKLFSDDFLDLLKDFKFTGDIYAVPEGTVVFPYEPLIRVTAPIFEAQFIETTLLCIINHQSLIATKAARVVSAADGDDVLEFGLRRAQGPDAALYGARAAIIGGCVATSNVLAGKLFDVPVRGTHAHSWIMSFPDELTAFREYAKLYPYTCSLLVDTYDTLKSGVPNAITVFSELRAKHPEIKTFSIRLDSGDFAYLSKEARKMLDSSGFSDVTIVASSDLDEYLIRDLKLQGAEIKIWGVGTNLITSSDCPAFGGVYKLSCEENASGQLEPKIKLSENTEKITTPGKKKIVRFYDLTTNKIKADLICLDDEVIDVKNDYKIFDPISTWKSMTMKAGTYRFKELLVPIFIAGECTYTSPSVLEIQEHCKTELSLLWDEHKRLVNPHIMPVDLSPMLWALKDGLIKKMRKSEREGDTNGVC